PVGDPVVTLPSSLSRSGGCYGDYPNAAIRPDRSSHTDRSLALLLADNAALVLHLEGFPFPAFLDGTFDSGHNKDSKDNKNQSSDGVSHSCLSMSNSRSMLFWSRVSGGGLYPMRMRSARSSGVRSSKRTSQSS